MNPELLAAWALLAKLPPVAHASYAMYILTVLLLLPPLIFILIAKRGRDLYIRRIPGIDAIEEAVGRATELGRPMMFSTGLTRIDPLLYALLSILRSIGTKAAAYGCRLIVPQNDYEVLPIVEETVREAYRAAGRYDQFNARDVRFLSTNQFAFASGYMGIAHREGVASCFLFGDFAAESLILAEAGQQVGAMQVAGTSSYTQVPFFLTSCDYTIIGEEVYAAGAYLSRDPAQLGSVRGQDVAKLVVLAIVMIGTVWATCLSILKGDYREGHEYSSPFARAFYAQPEQRRLLARIEVQPKLRLAAVPERSDLETGLTSARAAIRSGWGAVRRRLRAARALAAAEEKHLRDRLELFPQEGRAEVKAAADALAEIAARAGAELEAGTKPEDSLAGLAEGAMSDAERKLAGKLRERTAAQLVPEVKKLAYWAQLQGDDPDLGPAGPIGVRLAAADRLLSSGSASPDAMESAAAAAGRDCLGKYVELLRPLLRDIEKAAGEKPARHLLRTSGRIAKAPAAERAALGDAWPLILDATKSVSGRGRPLTPDYTWTVSPPPSAKAPRELKGPMVPVVFEAPGRYTIDLEVAEALRPVDNSPDLTLSIDGKEPTEVVYDSMPADTTISVKWRHPKRLVEKSERLEIDFGDVAADGEPARCELTPDTPAEERAAKSRHTYKKPGVYCMTAVFSGEIRAETLSAAQRRAASAAALAERSAPELTALRERLGRKLSELTDNLGALSNELNELSGAAEGYGQTAGALAAGDREAWPDVEVAGGIAKRAGELARFATAKANFVGPKAGAAEVFGAGRVETEPAEARPAAGAAKTPAAPGRVEKYWKRYRIYWTVLERLQDRTSLQIVVEEAPVLPQAPWKVEPPAGKKAEEKATGGGP